MKIIIDSALRLQDAPVDVLRKITAELTIKNPEYAKKKAIRLPRWCWGDEYIGLWREEKDGSIILPRGYYARLWELVGTADIDDKRLKLPYKEFPKAPELRDYQTPAVDLAKQWQQGVAIMPCGGGKTVTGDAIAAELMQPTIWITHTMDLLKQSMDSAVKFLGLKGKQIGVIQGDNMSIGSHMTFATVQTLYKRDLTDIRNRFGCVIVDECHQVFKDAAKTRMFESVISQFPAYYRFGLTASEYRSDGLISTMFHVIGPKFYEVAQDDPRLKVMQPRVEFIETNFEYDQGIDEDGEKERLSVQQMYKAMREDPLRNQVILKILLGQKPGDCTLVLGDSLVHLEYLCEFVSDFFGIEGHGYHFIHGESTKQERDRAMREMREGKADFLFATYQLAKLGLDIPRLNREIMVTPHKDRTTIQQAVGRLMRPEEGKPQPVVYDIYDSRIPQLRNWARERVKVYRNLGAEVIGGPKLRGGK